MRTLVVDAGDDVVHTPRAERRSETWSGTILRPDAITRLALMLLVVRGGVRSSYIHYFIFTHTAQHHTLPVSFEIRRLTRACNSKDAALSALALLRQAIHARPTAPATPGVPALGSLLFLLMCQMLICRARAVAAITVLRTPLQPMAR